MLSRSEIKINHILWIITCKYVLTILFFRKSAVFITRLYSNIGYNFVSILSLLDL